MKRFLLSFLVMGLVFFTQAQTIMYSEGFESNPAFVTVGAGGFGFVASGGAFVTGNTGGTNRPASVSYSSGGTNAYQVTNNTHTLTSGTLSTVGRNFVSLRFRLQAVSLNPTNGMDATDLVRIEISPDGGTNWLNTLEVRGNNESWWGYAATGVANGTYDGDNIPNVTSATVANDNNPAGPSTVIVRGIPIGNANVRVRITMVNNGAQERWVIDDIQLVSTSSAPLPINFANVLAKQTNAGVDISWSNLTESELNYYEVERSADGRNFTSIARLQPKANDYSKQDYNFTDPAPGAINYYRIKAVELNSSAKNSVILKVSKSSLTKPFIVYPNPVQNKVLAIQSGGVAAGVYFVQLINVNGQQVFTKTLNLQSGVVSQSLELPANIQSGIYMLRIEGAGTKSITTVVIH